MADEQTPEEEHAELMNTISALRGMHKPVPDEVIERFAKLDRQLNPGSQGSGLEGAPAAARDTNIDR